ncbi:MAG: hypothetical protein K6A72_12095 [Lachnospiraceae bacterium]|nr:hypothetical protein [Lachnospiraceae bacterium]
MSKVARKGTVIALVILLLTSMFSTAGAYGAQWPEKSFYGVGVYLPEPINFPNVKRQAYFGPSNYFYSPAGAYKATSVQNATALFREGDYALVDFYYPQIGKLCLYFQLDYLSTRNINEEVLTSYPAYITSEVQPMEGPGYDYHPLEETTPKMNIRQILLSRGTRIDVFFEMYGWVFAEFSCSLGLVRAWIPSSVVESY